MENTTKDIVLNSPELKKTVTLAEAYLVMFEFLNTNWDGCWETELGSVMGELSLWNIGDGDKAPMDAAILSTFLRAYEQICSIDNPIKNYSNADIKFK